MPAAASAAAGVAPASVRKQTAKDLAEGYSMGKRILDCTSVSVFTFLFVSNVVRTGRYYVHSSEVSWLQFSFAPVAIFLALLAGDMFSGFAHWAFDTWGSTSTLAFGPFIRSFREHHVDQHSITRHDFIETNGDNCLATLPVLLTQYFLPIISGGSWLYSPELHAYVVVLCFAVAVTNQIHKESHQRKPSPMAKFLMDKGLILTPQAHRIHHSGDFSHSYCITTGWLNKPLDAIGFWRGLESLVTMITGAEPRANDKKLLGE